MRWLVLIAILLSGCSSFTIREKLPTGKKCEAAYTRFMGVIDGAKGTNICGANAEVDHAKVDSEGISAATAPISTAVTGAALSSGVGSIAPVLPALIK